MNQARVIQVRSSNSFISNVIYVMHNAFRIKNNHALFHARSFKKKLSIVLINPFDTHERTLQFFEKGIEGHKEILLNIADNVSRYHRDEIPIELFHKNVHVVMDMYYLKEEKELYEKVLEHCINNDVSLDLVETNTLVPVTETSTKEEYNARTIRSKIHKKMNHFFDEVLQLEYALTGEKLAQKLLKEFIENKLKNYHKRNDPSVECGSLLSPYLKYGFISPLSIMKQLEEVRNANKESFIEELIVRRELAYNFVLFNNDYYKFEKVSYEWAYLTMDHHRNDVREYTYVIDDYTHFRTHDEYFNTAMKEMVYFGTMHGYMRMYWCKKIMEWSSSYEEAYTIAITLNNFYFIDGNTPNGYAGVAWCFGKHDRAWKEREIFGKIRYMNQAGLERKFDMKSYVNRIERKVKLYGK